MKAKHLLYVPLLALSYFLPGTHALWQWLDLHCFSLLNHSLDGNPTWQLFWALLNHKRMDIVEDFIFLTFFALALKRAIPACRTRRAAQFLFAVLFSASVIYFVNTLLFREYLKIPRPSPSLVVSPCVHLSEELPYLKIKDDASRSFPGDHATTLFLFGIFYTFFAGKNLGKYAWAYIGLRALPRLFTGAHWLTDVVLGGGGIACLFASLALMTPLSRWCIDALERALVWIQERLTKNHSASIS